MLGTQPEDEARAVATPRRTRPPRVGIDRPWPWRGGDEMVPGLPVIIRKGLDPRVELPLVGKSLAADVGATRIGRPLLGAAFETRSDDIREGIREKRDHGMMPCEDLPSTRWRPERYLPPACGPLLVVSTDPRQRPGLHAQDRGDLVGIDPRAIPLADAHQGHLVIGIEAAKHSLPR